MLLGLLLQLPIGYEGKLLTEVKSEEKIVTSGVWCGARGLHFSYSLPLFTVTAP